MATHNPLPHLLTIDELAEHLGVTVRHVRRQIAERRVPYIKVGHLVRFDPEQVRSWLDNNAKVAFPTPVPPASGRRSHPARRL